MTRAKLIARRLGQSIPLTVEWLGPKLTYRGMQVVVTDQVAMKVGGLV